MPLTDHLRVDSVGGVLVVTLLDHELRSDLVEQIRPQALRLLDEGHRRVLIDLQHVAFLESTALGLIIQLGAKLSRMSGKLALCGARPDVARLFKAPLFPFAIDLYADRDSALQMLNASRAF